jgi:hypothetical protein
MCNNNSQSVTKVREQCTVPSNTVYHKIIHLKLRIKKIEYCTV